MAHHASTPATILDAPVLRPLLVWSEAEVRTKRHRDHSHRVTAGLAFTGDVERDLTGRTVGVSRKGRKIRRPTTGRS